MVMMVGAGTGILLPDAGTMIHEWERIRPCGSLSHARSIWCIVPVCDDRIR